MRSKFRFHVLPGWARLIRMLRTTISQVRAFELMRQRPLPVLQVSAE